MSCLVSWPVKLQQTKLSAYEYSVMKDSKFLAFIYHISQPITRTVIFLLGILEKNNDECILILVIYWKKTGLLHTKICNHNIIYSSQKPRKLSYLKIQHLSHVYDIFMEFYNVSFILTGQFLCYCSFSTHTQAISSRKSFAPWSCSSKISNRHFNG